jgi:predicted metal-dependent hydrolase
MNHSPKFWALMAKKAPDHATLDAQLRNTHHCVPAWLEQCGSK